MDAEAFAHELIRLAFLMKRSGHDLFVRHEAHVTQVAFDLFIGGWSTNAEPTYSAYIYYDSDTCKEKAEAMLSVIRELYGEAG